MIRKILTLIFFFLLFTEQIFSQERIVETLQTGWKFSKTNPANAENPEFDDSNWEKVNIPHDWAIAGPFIIDGDGNTGKLPWKGEGWYRRSLEIPKTYGGKKVILIFDGVMAFPEIYINGKLAGKWDYGYNSFYVDITDFINYGAKNTLAVYANTVNHDSRWYPGGGIYRKVQMHVLNPVHAEIWSTYITTPIIKANYADLRISTRIANESSEFQNILLECIVKNPAGKEVLKDTMSGEISSNGSKLMEFNMQVLQPELWDLENPNLYSIEIRVLNGNTLLDKVNERFGIRSMRFTADDGFYLNDKRIQFKGVNLHSDFGPLGVAFNSRAMERQLQIMKDMGVNAIRNSHNVAAPELLQMCDEMGLLFFNEVFDKYDAKADILDTTNFEEFAERNIRNFVMRDRNHPSVFLWSVGNEVGDVQWNLDNGFYRLHTMLNLVNKYDPSRPTTLVNDAMESAKLRHFDLYDVHSWNYNRRYRLARKLEPNKSVIISESASTLSTRGFYEFPLPEDKTNFTKSLQVSSYDLNAPYWAEIGDDDFMWQQDEPYVAGEFVWTGFDYLGEPTPYNNKYVKELGFTDNEASRSSYFGIVDLVGIPKDRFYLYRSYWRPEIDHTHILPHWNWEGREGETTPVFVYTNAECAELFVNGKSQGKKCKDPDSENSTERFRLMWKGVNYEKGEIRAVSFKNGQKSSEAKVVTAGDAYKLKLSADRKTIKADGQDLSYILVEAFDKNGIPHPLANDELTISISGPVKIAGAGNGDPQSFDSFGDNKVKLFYGKAMIIISSDFKTGKANIAVESKNLKKDSIQLTIE